MRSKGWNQNSFEQVHNQFWFQLSNSGYWHVSQRTAKAPVLTAGICNKSEAEQAGSRWLDPSYSGTSRCNLELVNPLYYPQVLEAVKNWNQRNEIVVGNIRGLTSSCHKSCTLNRALFLAAQFVGRITISAHLLNKSASWVWMPGTCWASRRILCLAKSKLFFPKKHGILDAEQVTKPCVGTRVICVRNKG